MRRALAVLLGLSLAASAGARTLVITPSGTWSSGSYDRNYQVSHGLVLGVLGSLGASYDVIPARALIAAGKGNASDATSTLRTGSWGGVQYDCIVFTNWTRSGVYYTPTAGYSPDSLTLTAYWPSVPVVYVVQPAFNSGFAGNATACSTGANAAIGGGGALNSYDVDYFSPRDGRVWKSWTNRTGRVRTQSTDNAAAGTSRRVLVGLATGCTGASLGSLRRFERPDSVVGALTATPDTAVVWARYSTSKPAAPLIWTIPAAEVLPIAVALAHADSFSGGKVFDTPKQPSIAILITQAFRRGGGEAGTTPVNQGGTICNASGGCDTVTVKAVLDSLAGLGVPITVGVDLDSIAAYPYEKAWWARLGGNVRYTPLTYSGTKTGQPGMGNASPARPLDLWGYTRQRAIFPSGWTADSVASPTAYYGATLRADTSLYVLLRKSYGLVEEQFPGRVDHSVLAPYFDWSPGWNRTRHARDSLLTAIWYAGGRVIVTNVDDPLCEVNKRLAPGTAAQIFGTWLTSGGYAGASGLSVQSGQSFPVWTDPAARATVAGELAMISVRSAPTDSAASTTFYPSNLHSLTDEFLMGRLGTNRWYANAYPYYYHDFAQPLQVMSFTAAQLGAGTLPNNLGIPQRHAWWNIKWLVNQVQTINLMAGRTLVRFDYLENVR